MIAQDLGFVGSIGFYPCTLVIQGYCQGLGLQDFRSRGLRFRAFKRILGLGSGVELKLDDRHSYDWVLLAPNLQVLP